MATELLFASTTTTWDDLKSTITDSVIDLRAGRVTGFSVGISTTGQRVDVAILEDGVIRLIASGNDELTLDSRLTVRDERAVIAVGFSVASPSWGNFFWDWTAPQDCAAVASGVVRTLRDIYKVQPSSVEVELTL